jgi:hypothetical protein
MENKRAMLDLTVFIQVIDNGLCKLQISTVDENMKDVGMVLVVLPEDAAKQIQNLFRDNYKKDYSNE